jgi:hypothetical protein
MTSVHRPRDGGAGVSRTGYSCGAGRRAFSSRRRLTQCPTPDWLTPWRCAAALCVRPASTSATICSQTARSLACAIPASGGELRRRALQAQDVVAQTVTVKSNSRLTPWPDHSRIVCFWAAARDSSRSILKANERSLSIRQKLTLAWLWKEDVSTAIIGGGETTHEGGRRWKGTRSGRLSSRSIASKAKDSSHVCEGRAPRGV